MKTFGDLPEPAAPSTCLHCPVCGETYSATRGDYWDRLEQDARCARCIEPLRLVRRVVRYVQIRPWA